MKTIPLLMVSLPALKGRTILAQGNALWRIRILYIRGIRIWCGCRIEYDTDSSGM